MPLLTRRWCMQALAALPAASGRAAQAATVPLEEQLATLEARSGGRLGVSLIDTRSGQLTAYRGGERFPLCSTYKALAAAAVLARADGGGDAMDRPVPIRTDDLMSYSPATAPHAGGSMTLAALCEAAVTLSDNTAGNLLLAALGGPPGLTGFLRGIGDAVTRLDRTEPALNEAVPGDDRDTTTPSAMAADLHRLVVGDALSPGARSQFAAWLVACRTGDARLRAGAPPQWRVGDKTGTGERGTANDVGLLWPPGGEPLVVTVFLTGSPAPADGQAATIAAVARAVCVASGA